MGVKDILVVTSNPWVLDAAVQKLGGAVVGGGMPGGYVKVDGCYVVRCFRDPGFIKWAITRQGYGTVVRTLPDLV